jgi:hypothetical protein
LKAAAAQGALLLWKACAYEKRHREPCQPTNAYAQLAYVGWGCQVWAPKASDRGIAQRGISTGFHRGPSTSTMRLRRTRQR